MGERLNQCHIIEIASFTDLRGSLSAIEGTLSVPFHPKRFYYIYGVPEGARRGCHAHRTEKELIMALAGSFYVLVDDGNSRMDLLLDRPDRGLYVPPLIWHEVHSFVSGSVCAVLASTHYDSNDYYRRYEDFVNAIQCR